MHFHILGSFWVNGDVVISVFEWRGGEELSWQKYFSGRLQGVSCFLNESCRRGPACCSHNIYKP